MFITRALFAAVMCSLPAVYVIVCVIHLTPTVSQCTTKYCTDDNNDNYVDALTAMVSRLQNTVERLERQHQEQEKQHQDSTEQLQQQFNDSLEQQRKRYQKSLDQLEQEFNDSMEQHQEYVIMLENTMKENISTLEQGMIYIFLIASRLFDTIFFRSFIYFFMRSAGRSAGVGFW